MIKMNYEVDIVKKSLEDFLTSKMLRIALVPLIVTMVILYLLFFAAADVGLSSLHQMATEAQNGQEIVLDEDMPFYINWIIYGVVFLFKYSFTSWIASFLLYTIGIAIILQVSIILSLAVLGFFTPMIVKILHKRHYSHLPQKEEDGILSVVWQFLKAFIMMFVLFVLLIPTYFVPIIGVITLSLPMYYFFHKLLNYDVSSNILTKQQYKTIYKKEANNFRIRTLIMYFMSMIPFVTLFSAVYFIIHLAHAYFIELEILLKNQNNSLENTQKSIS